MGIDCRIHIEYKPFASSKRKYKYLKYDGELNSKSTIWSIVEKCNTKDAFILNDLIPEVKSLDLKNGAYMFAKMIPFKEIIDNKIDGWLIYHIGRKFARYKYPDIRLIIEFF